MVVVASPFIDATEVERRIDGLLADTLPRSAAFVRNNLEALVRLQGAAGVTSVVGWFYSRAIPPPGGRPDRRAPGGGRTLLSGL